MGQGTQLLCTACESLGGQACVKLLQLQLPQSQPSNAIRLTCTDEAVAA